MATVGTVRTRDLSRYKLHQLHVSSISDTNTVTTGIPGIQHVMTRRGSGTVTVSSMLAPSDASYAGTTGTTRRVQAFLSNAATGEITFDTGAGGSGLIVMIWSKQ